jgi:hypothetical protein
MKAIESKWAPWVGLFVSALAWVIDHQLGSDVTYWRCSASGPLFVGVLGVLCFVIALGASWFSWTSREHGQDTNPETRRFVASLSAAGACAFGLAIALQTLAGFIVPTCAR